MSKRSTGRAASATTVRIPRQRGRGSDPFVVVVPHRPSLTRLAAGAVVRWLWLHRRPLAPLAAAVAALPLALLLNTLGWWTSLVIAPAVAVPTVWLAINGHLRLHDPLDHLQPALLALLATAGLAWLALAAGFGPWAGPLDTVWVLITLAAQSLWLLLGLGRKSR